jgi:two-component system nitrogen regulation sensor histidine kinase GlnL
VLEGFRDFASIDELNLELVDLKELVRRQVDLLKPRARQAQIAVHVEHTPDLPKITADCIRLEQVLLNLLLNAIEAMPDGGSVTIRTETTGDGVKIQVRDTGYGIPTDLQDRILDPYFTTKSDGTGLGLALCEKIMRQHNGSLDFRSTDTGTAFEMLIPSSQHSATDFPQRQHEATN